MSVVQTKLFVVLLVVGVGLAGLGSYASLREGQVYLAQGTNGILRIAALTEQNIPPTLSYEGQRSTLQDCELLTRSMNSLQMRYIAEAERPALLDKCRTMAEVITASAPTDTFAWLVAAEATAEQGDMTAAFAHYVASVETGPNEQWVAENRVTFAEAYLDQLPPDLQKRHEADLRMLAQSEIGLAYLARRYVAHADFRPRITAILETVPANFHSTFIFNVQQQIGKGPTL